MMEAASSPIVLVPPLLSLASMTEQMPVTDNTVVPKIMPATEDKFHAAMMAAIAPLIAAHGKGEVASALGVTIRQLDNIAAGSFPAPWRLANLLALDGNALDSLTRLYGLRLVPRHSTCSTDPVSVQLAQLLTRTIDLEKPDSDGGAEVTLRELNTLDERTLRAAACKLAAWVERIDAYRSGAAPNLKSVG